MTNKQILKKAVDKAVKGGWEGGKYYQLMIPAIDKIKVTKYAKEDEVAATALEDLIRFGEIEKLEDRIIFNHDFAKAFWGELPMHNISDKRQRPDGEEIDDIGYARLYNWQYHLQQMVLEEDRMFYVSKFL